MSAVLKLPPELREFLSLPGPQTLLIRGPPGSGKTTLALSLLEEYVGSKIFLTGRVANPDLGRLFPWLPDAGIGVAGLIDTTKVESASSTALAWSHLSNLVAGEDSAQRDLSSFLWLPEQVQEAWSRIQVGQNTLLAIDSWDSLVESYLGSAPGTEVRFPDRTEIERLLFQRMAQAKPIHMVIVLERDAETRLDYMVNGVIQTSVEVVEERVHRWLRLRKLRGIRIENPLYPYTLEGAKFRCILPVAVPTPIHPLVPDQDPAPVPGSLWPGSKAYASSFGRLPLGQSTLLQFDGETPAATVTTLVVPMIAQVLRDRGPALLASAGRLDPDATWSAFERAVDVETFRNNLRLLEVGHSHYVSRATEADPSAKMLLPPAMPDAEAAPSLSAVGKFFGQYPDTGPPGILVASLLLAPETLDDRGAQFRDRVELLRSLLQDLNPPYGLHRVVAGTTGTPEVRSLAPVSTARISISSHRGRVFLRGIVPWTHAFLLAEEPTGVYGLVRVV